MKRVALDVASQALPIATTFLDRLLLTSILIRGFGVERFEYWSLAMSAAGLLTLIDSGCFVNFSNMVVRHIERGDRERAIAVYRQSNTIFLLMGLVAAALALALALSPALQVLVGIEPGRFAGDAAVVLFALGAATALRLAVSNLATVYRAELEFGWGTVLSSVAEVARILGVAGVVLAGGGLQEAAIAHLVGTGLGIALTGGLDTWLRHPRFRFALDCPRREDMAGSMRNSLAFGLPLFPFIAINQGAVLALGGDTGPGTGAIAVFVLMRTLANVAQSIIGKVTNVLAMEIARHGLRGDDTQARALLAPLNRLSAVVFGVGAGVFLGLGASLTALWTGSAALYDARIIALLMAPMLVAPGYLLARSYLMYRNTPLVWTIGAFVHVALALVIYVLASGFDPALRITLAISLGEIIALAIPVTLVAMGGARPRVILDQLLNAAIAFAAAGVTWAVARATGRLVETSALGGLLFALAAIAIVGGAALAALALPVYRRLRAERAAAVVPILDPREPAG